MSNLPTMTDEQRREALKKSAEARAIKARIKQQVADGTLKVSQVLDMQDEAVRRIKVFQLLKAVPGVGTKKAEAFMEAHRISPNRRLAGLGKHQRAALIEAFG